MGNAESAISAQGDDLRGRLDSTAYIDYFASVASVSVVTAWDRQDGPLPATHNTDPAARGNTAGGRSGGSPNAKGAAAFFGTPSTGSARSDAPVSDATPTTAVMAAFLAPFPFLQSARQSPGPSAVGGSGNSSRSSGATAGAGYSSGDLETAGDAEEPVLLGDLDEGSGSSDEEAGRARRGSNGSTRGAQGTAADAAPDRQRAGAGDSGLRSVSAERQGAASPPPPPGPARAATARVATTAHASARCAPKGQAASSWWGWLRSDRSVRAYVIPADLQNAFSAKAADRLRHTFAFYDADG
jgi:hypothetical protein